MKLQFKLMSLALIVFASNVQAAEYKFAGVAALAKASLTRNNAKTAAKVLVPVAAVTGLYKLNKAGKLESVKANAKKAASNVASFVGAKAKQAGNNVASWIKNHKKTTVGLVAGAVATGALTYNREKIGNAIVATFFGVIPA